MRRQPANTRDGPAGGVDMDDGRVKIDKSILIHEIRLMWIMIDDADLQQGSLGDGWSQARKEIFFHLLGVGTPLRSTPQKPPAPRRRSTSDPATFFLTLFVS